MIKTRRTNDTSACVMPHSAVLCQPRGAVANGDARLEELACNHTVRCMLHTSEHCARSAGGAPETLQRLSRSGSEQAQLPLFAALRAERVSLNLPLDQLAASSWPHLRMVLGPAAAVPRAPPALGRP